MERDIKDDMTQYVEIGYTFLSEQFKQHNVPLRICHRLQNWNIIIQKIHELAADVVLYI